MLGREGGGLPGGVNQAPPRCASEAGLAAARRTSSDDPRSCISRRRPSSSFPRSTRLAGDLQAAGRAMQFNATRHQEGAVCVKPPIQPTHCCSKANRSDAQRKKGAHSGVQGRHAAMMRAGAASRASASRQPYASFRTARLTPWTISIPASCARTNTVLQVNGGQQSAYDQPYCAVSLTFPTAAAAVAAAWAAGMAINCLPSPAGAPGGRW